MRIINVGWFFGSWAALWSDHVIRECDEEIVASIHLEQIASENKIPNLDAMSSDDLMAFWMRHQRGRGRKELGLSGKGSVNTTSSLACYASNKATAMSCRLRGDINTAVMYEGIADRIYNELPESAKW